MRPAFWMLAGATVVVALAGPAYVAWATWDLYKSYTQPDLGEEDD